MNSLSQLRKLPAALALAGVAALMLPACSSTEEAPPPEEGYDSSQSYGGYDECMERCTGNQEQCETTCSVY